MNTDSYITSAMRQAFGTSSPAVEVEIEKGAVGRFVEALKDSYPVQQDNVDSSLQGVGEIIAPPTFLRSLPSGWDLMPFVLPVTKGLDGGSEWEYFEPVRVGDRIQVMARLNNALEREGRFGKMVLLFYEITYENQFGRLVAVQKNTVIYY